MENLDSIASAALINLKNLQQSIYEQMKLFITPL